MKNNQKFDIIRAQTDAAWFGFAIVLRKIYWHQLEELKQHLHSLGIEHRPIISGNMVRQPFNELYNVGAEATDFVGAEIIHHGGLFIGLHSKPLSDTRINLLTSALLQFNWRPKPRILITGGSGMLGNALKSTIVDATTLFLSSKDGDLRDLKQTEMIFRRFHPTHVIHAAADVGGLYKNLHSNLAIGTNNILMNTNVIKCALKFQVRNLVEISSTCVFPERSSEFNESMIHDGAPHASNASYAMSKRLMHLHIARVRESTGYKWNILIPCNMYGPYDSFCPVNGHVIGSLIGKATSQLATLQVYGTGRARRQFMYVEDFARIIAHVIHHPIWFQDLICAPKEEISIADTARIIANLTDKEIEYDETKTDGQLIKYASSVNFGSIFPDFKWTPFERGMQKTLEWYKQNK
jgi:GDP-L-fucose synthase